VSAVVEGARRLVGRGGADVVDRIDALEEAARSGRGRLPDDLVDEAAAVADRAGSRLRLSGDHTVVALAGATGSGKSSTFNAVTGLDVAATGVRRPTTSWTMACTWGADGAVELLDWLGVPKRHQVRRDSMLDDEAAPAPGAVSGERLDGLVLLDLPDHDSTEVAHHVEVDRLVKLADLLVWVLDPQKYADAALHERYLRPLATHRDVMLVVLNHIDEVAEARRPAMIEDLERRLAEDGLETVPVIATSARDGDGIPELTRAIARRVGEKKAVKARLMADVGAVAQRMQDVNGDAKPGDVGRARTSELVDSFADAAGVPTVVRAVEQSTRRRAAQATGWPVTSWLSRFKPDPLRRLHLDLGLDRRGGGKELTSAARTSVPEATHVQRARVDTAVRSLSDEVGSELSPPWADAVRRASTSRLPDLGDALDRAVTSTDLGVSRTPLWWRGVRFLQWLLVLTALVGGLWLLVLAVLGYLQLSPPSTPDTSGLPLPTLLLLGGVALGILLGLVCKAVVRLSARRKARSAERRLRSAIDEVAVRLVVEPVQAEVEAYRATRAALATAARR
jgi:GTP-binding protein EngB required for normal cell division